MLFGVTMLHIHICMYVYNREQAAGRFVSQIDYNFICVITLTSVKLVYQVRRWPQAKIIKHLKQNQMLTSNQQAYLGGRGVIGGDNYDKQQPRK